jgi:hypothetical protein
VSPIIQEVVAVEVKLRFKNETYAFYLTGPYRYHLTSLSNTFSEPLNSSSHKTPRHQMSVERAKPMATLQCSEDYCEARLKTYQLIFAGWEFS